MTDRAITSIEEMAVRALRKLPAGVDRAALLRVLPGDDRQREASVNRLLELGLVRIDYEGRYVAVEETQK